MSATPFTLGFPANLRLRTISAESPPCTAARVCSRFCPNMNAGTGSAPLTGSICVIPRAAAQTPVATIFIFFIF